MNGATKSTDYFTLLSNLLLGIDKVDISEEIISAVANYGREDFGKLWELATTHHVILRAFPALHHIMLPMRLKARPDWTEWIESAMATERARIHNALSFLSPICRALESAGDVIVIKALDHWPDLGSDLDLYTTARGADVVAIMRERFHAQLAQRSWGDRLAGKWNFIVPGLPELLEVHAGRLGQTGEQVSIADSLVARAEAVQFESHTFRVPRPEDRVMISTLQRMYRHFYLRLCDIVDMARLVESGTIDYVYLRSLAQSAGLWDGLATYLTIVEDYVASYRGENLPLPAWVRNAAQFGGNQIRIKRKFLRVPIFPHAASLYAKEWTKLLYNGELQNTLRLSLLPGMAMAAALAFKITGNDKGIW
jgi:hypothetical protein